MDITNKELQTLIWHVRPCCQFCGAYAGYLSKARPATRISYTPEKNSYYREGFFCDKHSFNEPEYEEGWREEFGIDFPVEQEFEDIPHADIIRKVLKEK